MGPVGKYEIVEQIGGGAMGIVFCARDTALQRQVALKTIRTGLEVDPVVRHRFFTEARACARLQHPSIVTVYDLGEVENTAYIAMELLSGSDFRRIIQDRKPLPLATKIAAVAQVCEAVAHAHRHGVVHRDIKPSNLFLTDDGRAKVLDFGIARLPSSRLTVAGQILGTPNSMAPEQILDHPTDGRADLFSVAVVFFELLTYAHPFAGASIPRRIVQSAPDSLFVYDPTLPPILERVIDRAFAKEPERRYQTGDEFAADLHLILNAIRHNVSPGSIALPSHCSLTPVTEPVVAKMAPPDGEDPHEWRLSEALRLLPRFEGAIDSGDSSSARAILADLEARLAGDFRFSDAIRLCQSRLAEIVSLVLVPAGEVSPLPAADYSSRAPATPSVQSPSDAMITADLDLSFLGSRPAMADNSGDPTTRPRPTDAKAVQEPAVIPANPKGQPPPRAQSPRLSRGATARNIKPIIIFAGTAVSATLLAAVIVLSRRPAPIEVAVATASVVRNAPLYERPDTTGSRIGSLVAGARVNILQLPGSANQQWIRVQLVRPKVFSPGYVQLDYLDDWRGTTGDSALELARIFGAGNSATEGRIEAQIGSLGEIAARFPTEPAAKQARLDIIHWKLILARRRLTAGALVGDLQRDLVSLREDLGAFAGERDLQARAVALTNQTDALISATKPPPPQVLVAPQSVDIKPLVSKAQQFWDAGDYDGALSTLRTILRQEPANKQALNLKARIDRAVALEKQYEKK